VGPAAATAAGVPESTTRRTEGVTSRTETTVRTSTGRSPSSAGGPSGVVTDVEPKRADPAVPGGMGSTGPAIEDGSGSHTG
jgi:hypothetical protein